MEFKEQEIELKISADNLKFPCLQCSRYEEKIEQLEKDLVKKNELIKELERKLTERIPNSQTIKEDSEPGEFELIKLIGRGSYGAVYKVQHKLDGQLYALKKVICESDESVEIALSEVRVLCKLDHLNVVRYFGCSKTKAIPEDLTDIDPTNNEDQSTSHCYKEELNSCNTVNYILHITMELCAQALSDLIKTWKETPTESRETMWSIMYQLMDGLEYLHNEKIVHGDLNPRNIFMTADGTIKIGDFGLSKPARNDTEKCLGNKNFEDGRRSDIRDLGTTILRLQHPSSNEEVIGQVQSGFQKNIWQNVSPSDWQLGVCPYTNLILRSTFWEDERQPTLQAIRQAIIMCNYAELCLDNCDGELGLIVDMTFDRVFFHPSRISTIYIAQPFRGFSTKNMPNISHTVLARAREFSSSWSTHDFKVLTSKMYELLPDSYKQSSPFKTYELFCDKLQSATYVLVHYPYEESDQSFDSIREFKVAYDNDDFLARSIFYNYTLAYNRLPYDEGEGFTSWLRDECGFLDLQNYFTPKWLNFCGDSNFENQLDSFTAKDSKFSEHRTFLKEMLNHLRCEYTMNLVDPNLKLKKELVMLQQQLHKLGFKLKLQQCSLGQKFFARWPPKYTSLTEWLGTFQPMDDQGIYSPSTGLPPLVQILCPGFTWQDLGTKLSQATYSNILLQNLQSPWI